MSKRERRKVIAKSFDDISVLGQMTKEELLAESEKYEPENYSPLSNIEEKVMLVPENKTEVITIRFSERENILLKQLAVKNGLSRSAYLRSIIINSLNGSVQELQGVVYNDLEKRMRKIERHLSEIGYNVTQITKHIGAQCSREAYSDFEFAGYSRNKKYEKIDDMLELN